jgi:hypothetical protein
MLSPLAVGSRSEATHGLDQRDVAGAVELFSQVADVSLDHARVAVEVVAPDVIEDLCLAHDPAGVDQQVAQQVELGGREIDDPITAAHLVRLLVDREIVVAQGVGGAIAARAPKHCAYARHQLLEAERLADVIVGAKRESVHPVGGGVTGGQEQHRDLGGFVRQPPVDLEAVPVRQHHVQHDQVGPKRLRGAYRRAAVGRALDLEPLVAKHGRDQLGDALLVVDDEHARWAVALR